MSPITTGIGVGEHWHTDDQFERQLGGPGQRAVIEGRWRAFAEALASEAVPRTDRPLQILDAGCGDGINLVGLRRALAAARQDANLTAIDLSPLRAQRARADGRANGRIAVASVTSLPFADGTFDVLLCNHVLEHVPHPVDGARELRRVLRPGGLALVGVPNEGCLLAQLRNHALQRSVLRVTDHVNFFTAASLTQLLTAAGLSVGRVLTEGFFLPHLRLTTLAVRTATGRAALEYARRAIPSQAAGLLAVARRPLSA